MRRTWGVAGLRPARLDLSARAGRKVNCRPGGRGFAPMPATRLERGRDARRAVVGTAADVGPLQDVSAVYLVVQRVEPIGGRPLRFGMQRLLELLNLWWRW